MSGQPKLLKREGVGEIPERITNSVYILCPNLSLTSENHKQSDSKELN